MQSMDKTNAQLFAVLETLGGRQTHSDDVAFEGSRFIIPESMDLREAVRFLAAKVQEDDQRTTFSRRYYYRPVDGAVVAMRAIKKAFGMAIQVPTKTLVGDAMPELRTVDVGIGQTEQAPFGSMVLPQLPEAVVTFGEWQDEDYGRLFHVTVEGPKKYRFLIEGLFTVIRQELDTASIYRGKAFDGAGTFLDLAGVDPERVTYSADVMTQLDANIWSMLNHSEAMRKAGISLKRSVLLYGPYGTGKTLAAFLTALIAERNGWTFVYCRPGKDNLDDVMRTAQLYMPAVVFFEDIDVISDVSTMDDGPDTISRLLDTFDGITAKGTELLVVMTTNHAERIHKGMVRPGRLDAVIHIGALDRHGLVTMMRDVIPAEVFAVDDFDAVAKAMDGYMPAFVKEALERSLRYAIARGNGSAEKVTTADVCAAAEGLRAQHDLMLNAAEHKVIDPLSVSMAHVMRQALGKDFMAISGDIDAAETDIKSHTENVGSDVRYGVDRDMQDNLNSTSVQMDNGDEGYLSR